MPILEPSTWDDIVGHVRVNHPTLVRRWFAELEPQSVNGGIMCINARNHAQVRYLAQHCQRPFAEAAQAATGLLVAVEFGSDSAEDGGADDNGHRREEWSDEELVLNLDYVFDNFVTGPCNRLAHAAAVAVSEAPGRAYNPLFLHGSVGLGKTHLLQAICHGVSERSRRHRIVYISCETFTNDFINAVESGALNLFRYRYRHADLLVIDDIQFLAERERSQEEFFHTFNTLYQLQRQIVLSADSYPAEIPSLQERLVSRFKSGLVATLERPCLETRMAIIRKKARLRCIDVPEDVIQLLAARAENNIRELEGLLIKMHAIALTRRSAIDYQVALEALGDGNRTDNVSISDIVAAVTDTYKVKLSDLQGKKRTKSVTLPRHVCMYLARELTQYSLEEIGGYFGGRDHTTVLHANRLITHRRQVDGQLNLRIEGLRNRLLGTAHDKG